MNSNAKLYLGLTASSNTTHDEYTYLQPEEAGGILQSFQCKYSDLFRSVMVYEATASEANVVDGMSYAGAIQKYLKESSYYTKASFTSTTSSTPSAVSVTLPTGAAPATSSSLMVSNQSRTLDFGQ